MFLLLKKAFEVATVCFRPAKFKQTHISISLLQMWDCLGWVSVVVIISMNITSIVVLFSGFCFSQTFLFPTNQPAC